MIILFHVGLINALFNCREFTPDLGSYPAIKPGIRMDTLTSPFPRKAASASLYAPLLSCALYIYLQTHLRPGRPGLGLFEALPVLLLITGLALGLIAFWAAWRGTGPGVMGIKRATCAVIINLAVIVCLCGATPNPLAGAWHPFTGLAPGNPALRTYDQDGVRFSFDEHWNISDRPAVANLAASLPFSREIVVRRSDGAAGIGLMFLPFDPTRDDYRLEDCARWLTFTGSGLNQPPVFNVTADVGGMARAGVGLRLKSPARVSVGFPWQGEADFFLLENPHLRVLVFTAGADLSPACRTEMESLLSSLRIKGLNDFTAAKGAPAEGPHVEMILYSPTRPIALIAGQRVATGDSVGGYRIIAINKEWISVQGPDGKTKVLGIGDGFK